MTAANNRHEVTNQSATGLRQRRNGLDHLRLRRPAHCGIQSTPGLSMLGNQRTLARAAYLKPTVAAHGSTAPVAVAEWQHRIDHAVARIDGAVRQTPVAMVNRHRTTGRIEIAVREAARIQRRVNALPVRTRTGQTQHPITGCCSAWRWMNRYSGWSISGCSAVTSLTACRIGRSARFAIRAIAPFSAWTHRSRTVATTGNTTSSRNALLVCSCCGCRLRRWRWRAGRQRPHAANQKN